MTSLRLNSATLQEFKKYKPALLFFGLISLIFKFVHQRALSSVEQDTANAASATTQWTEQLATYIRHNDIALMESCRKILKQFEEL